MLNTVPKNVSFGELEKEILQFWKKNQIFEKSLELRRDGETYIFYDGPPFATGLPHYGHLLAGTIKDVVPRYQTMKGKYVDRTFGWDCHGLPVENEMEKELGLSSRHEIEEYGVARFNEACRSIVMRYTEEWKELVERIGRWVDFDNGYKTMDRDFMESTWWVFKQLWDKGLVYEGHKILPYCPRCATPLSNFEANQGYEEVQDPSVTIRFQAPENPRLYYLSWTTTPWTLPSNMALAVGPDIEYVQVHDPEDGCEYILASDCLDQYYGGKQPEVIARFKGRELVGRDYTPLFPYFQGKQEEGAFRIVPADFVTTESGTGIVHIAPGFGEDDAEIGRQESLPVVCPIDEECRFTTEVSDYQGESVKETDKKIINRLKKEGKLVHRSDYQHSYPHCWRCETPLIYRAVSTWFVHVEAIKDRMLAANSDIHWVPEHIRDG
ncbi:MAG: class I tRNA ligase family protein, partial [Verrucomicrobiota bacterium]